MTTNPLFVSAAAADFHLQAASASINAGTSLPDVPNDFDGVSRPQGGAYDIGACEFGQASQPSPPSNLRIVATQ